MHCDQGGKSKGLEKYFPLFRRLRKRKWQTSFRMNQKAIPREKTSRYIPTPIEKVLHEDTRSETDEDSNSAGSENDDIPDLGESNDETDSEPEDE